MNANLRSIALLLPAALALGACEDPSTPKADDPDTNPPPADSCAPHCATAFVERGEHGAGYRVLQAGDLPIKAWYPADVDPSAIEYHVSLKLPGLSDSSVVIHGEATPDADVAGAGPYPLVVLSHGFSGNPEWYRTLAEHLATHGFVVLAPEHDEADWFTDVVPATLTRPAQVSATIDFAAEGPLASFIDPQQVAVVGHSYGGYTALATAGARFDVEALAARCETVEDEFTAAYFCGPFLEQQGLLAAGLGLDAPPSGLWPAVGDARVDAIVTIAGDAYLFGQDGLGSVSVPTLALGGTADTGTPWDWGAALTFEGVGSALRALVGLEGGEHFLPVADCGDMPWTDALPEFERGYICDDPAWDRQAAHDVVHHFTAAFLRATLLDDPAAYEALWPTHYDTPTTPGVAYEAIGL